MLAQDIAQTAFSALRTTADGWQFTLRGLLTLEEKLDAAVAAGSFAECALEIAALSGFLVLQGNAEPALEQLQKLGQKFELFLIEIATDRHNERDHQQKQTSSFLGLDVQKAARHHDTPQTGVSLSKLVPLQLLDPRTFGRRPNLPRSRIIHQSDHET